jgi:hypothetical protein
MNWLADKTISSTTTFMGIRPQLLVATLLVTFLAGCGTPAEPVEESDGADDTFLSASGKADGGGIVDGSPEALGVLKLVNTADFVTLDDDVRLDRRAATNIVAHRQGLDGADATTDDDLFDDLRELDAIKYVGKRAFARLLAYAQANGFIEDPEPVAFDPADRQVDVLFTAPYCDVCDFTDKAILRRESPIIHGVIEGIDAAQTKIDVAQFSFSVTEIEHALHRAMDRGVTLRIVMNHAQEGRNSRVNRLEEAGAQVLYLKGRPAQTENGVHGLMHNKYMRVDDGVLLTGSNNWSSTGTSFNAENTMRIRTTAGDPMIAAYDCYTEKMWAGSFDDAASCSDGDVQFTPGIGAYHLGRDAMNEAQTSIDVMMHHLTFDRAVRDLAVAAERGVRVRIVVNVADRDEHTKTSNYRRLVAAGGEVRFKRNFTDGFQLQHHKLVIVDDRVLVNGSGNWSGAALFNNYENYVRYEQLHVVQAFVSEFARLWRWSLSPASLDAGLNPAQQHAGENAIYFGNLHAHFASDDAGHLNDDGHLERHDENGETVTVSADGDPAAFAYTYARDQGKMDFLLLSPHCTDQRSSDGATQANITDGAFADLGETAARVTADSEGEFVAMSGVEWSTNSSGNHVNILGVGEPVRVDRGRFDTLYDDYLPGRAALGEAPIVQLNHPRTFGFDEERRRGNFDQLYVSLLEMERSSERRRMFNDYGLDNYAPVRGSRAKWISGEAIPDRATVNETLDNIWSAASPFVRLFEVTVGRGLEIRHEEGQNPSIVPDPDTGDDVRFTKVHSDWDYYLLRGFRTAPTANHDNHYANWGTGHTTRTAVVAPELSSKALHAAMRDRAVYASEDENLELRMYAGGRVPAGGELVTAHGRTTLDIALFDPDHDGPYDVLIYTGVIGGDEVKVASELTINSADWHQLEVDLASGAEHFVYVEVHMTDLNRYAWSAPVWVTSR